MPVEPCSTGIMLFEIIDPVATGFNSIGEVLFEFTFMDGFTGIFKYQL